jgi:hypothetical protein
MVRRIVDDSDFEEEEEISQSADGDKGSIDEIAVSSPEEVISRLNSPGPTTAPRSVRKVIRQRDLESKESGTYDYNSDIYTEESSLGSFIVDSDDDEVQPSEDEGPG